MRVMRELSQLFYQDSEGNLKGPISSVDKIAQDIIKYVKRKFLKLPVTVDLSIKKAANE